MPYTYDPLAETRRLLGISTPTVRRRRRQPLIPPLKEEEERSLLSEIGSGLLSGVGFIGGVIDKTLGGRAIRGLLGGEPREILSIIPGSDITGITDRAQEVTGRDLLEKADILAPNRPGLDWGDVAGFGASVALSPASYIFPGSGGAAAKVLKGVGRMPKGWAAGMRTTVGTALKGAPAETIETAKNIARIGKLGPWEKLLEQPARGLAGWGLPLTRTARVVTGTGPISQKIAGAFDWGVEGLRWSRPGIHAAAAFKASAGGFTTRAGQEVSKTFTGKYKTGLGEVGEEIFTGYFRPLQKAGLAEGGEVGKVSGRIIGMIQEGFDPATGIFKKGFDPMTDPMVLGAMKKYPVLRQQYHVMLDVGKKLRKSMGDVEAGYSARGIPLSHRPDYMFRQFRQSPEQLAKQGGAYTGPPQVGAAKDAAQIARQIGEGPYDLGTHHIRDISLDPVLSGATRTAKTSGEATRHILQRYMGWTAADIKAGQAAAKTVGAAKRKVDDAIAGMASTYGAHAKQAEDLAEFVHRNMTPWHTKHGIGAFETHPVLAAEQRLGMAARSGASADAFTEHAARLAMPMEKAEALAGRQWVPLSESMVQAGLGKGQYAHPNAVRRFAEAKGLGAAWEGLDETAAATQASGIARGWVVPREFADAFARTQSAWKTPEVLKPMVRGLDYATNVFRPAVTTAPAFWQRNLNTGFWQAFVIGARDPRFSALNPRTWYQPWVDARSLVKNGYFKGASELPIFRGAFKGMTKLDADRAASQLLAQKFAAREFVSPQHLLATEGLQETAAHTLPELARRIPGEVPFPSMLPHRLMGRMVPRSWREAAPWNVAGAGAPRGAPDVTSYFREGRQLNTYIENLNRIGPAIAKLRQGMDLDEALSMVTAANVDYGRFARSAFESKVMRRLVPFYQWTRGMLPWQLREIATHPGGPVGLATKAARELRPDEGFLPPHLAQGLGIPIGEEKDGQQRYLTKLDLPHEGVFGMFRPGVNLLDTITGTAQEGLGQLNPLLKVPAELATGTQFFTGRRLEDLDSTIGRTAQNILGLEQPPAVSPVWDEFLSASPLTRAATTLRTATDPRKGLGAKALNITTGLRVSDVDMDKARRLAARKVIRKRLAGRPGIHRMETVYTTPEELPILSAEDILMLQLNQSLRRRRKR